jgi:hypothetical protein
MSSKIRHTTHKEDYKHVHTEAHVGESILQLGERLAWR